MQQHPHRRRSPSRLALIIGNAAYGDVGELPNAARDVELITQRMEAVGIEVHPHIDLDRPAVEEAFQAFILRLKGLGKVDTVIFYFAGHGYQDGEINCLLPITAANEPFDPIRLQDKIDDLSGLSQRLLVFLDACRESFDAERVEDGLMRSRGLSIDQRPVVRKGLADFATDDETFISFSAAPGQPAADGIGECPNSPYALALSRFITEVDLPLAVMMSRVRNSVSYDSNKKQRTWDSSSLNSSFFFKPSSLLFLFGNTLALVASFVALLSLVVVLYEVAVADFGNYDGRWIWACVSLAVLGLSIAAFLYGVGRAYSRVRGEQSEWQTEGRFRLLRWSSAGINGAIGGVLGGILGSALVMGPYWYDWRNGLADFRVPSDFCTRFHWADPRLPDLCPRLGQLTAEGSVAGIYILTLLGFFAMHFSEWAVRGRPRGVIKARREVQMMAGAVLGGALAGVVVGPVVTAYFGAQDRPFLEPRAILVTSIVAVAAMAFCIVNYRLETFTALRLLRSFAGAVVGTICALMVLSAIVGFLYWTGFIENTLQWAHDGFWDLTKPLIERYAYVLVAGLPYGIVFGFSFGVLVATTRLFSEPAEETGDESRAA